MTTVPGGVEFHGFFYQCLVGKDLVNVELGRYSDIVQL